MREGAAATSEGSDVRRRFVTIALFLLAGSVVNVAVAWGIVQWSNEYPYTAAFEKLGQQADWPREVPRDWPLPQFQALGRTWGLSIQNEVVHPSLSRTSPGLGMSLFRSGWPCRAVEVEYQGPHFLGTPLNPSWRYSIELPQRLKVMRIDEPMCYRPMPYRPIWPGFAINTLFYAGLLWLLIPGPFALRRLIRHRRGLCPACGYDLRHGEHEACPECGVTA